MLQLFSEYDGWYSERIPGSKSGCLYEQYPQLLEKPYKTLLTGSESIASVDAIRSGCEQQEMHLRRPGVWVSELYYLSKGSWFWTCASGGNHQMANPKNRERCMKFPWIHQILQAIHLSICSRHSRTQKPHLLRCYIEVRWEIPTSIWSSLRKLYAPTHPATL